MNSNLKPVGNDRSNGITQALALLRNLERLNWDECAPEASKEAVRAALLSAAGSADNSLDGFAEVLTDWLTCNVIGISLNLDDYEQIVIEDALPQ